MFHAGARTGATGAIRNSPWRGRQLLILGYHGVALADEAAWNPELFMPVELLATRFEYLRKSGFQILPLELALGLLAEGRLPPRSAVITFDDGFYNFHAQARPLLEAYGFASTVYLSTYYCSKRLPVFDPLCCYVLWKGRGRRIDLGGLVPEGGVLEAGAGAVERDRRAACVVAFAKAHLDAQEKHQLAGAIATRAHVDFDEIVARRLFALLSPEEVKQCAASSAPTSIELHTHTHAMPMERSRFLTEVETNRAHIMRILGRPEPPRHLCFPSGAFEACHLAWMRETDIRSGVTCEPGLASARDNPLCLPRIIDMACFSALWFDAVASGLADWLPKRSRLASGGYRRMR
jgi:peptidoglycan/xylan/chitin deacetylase (PgdA/CDA1 family)